MTRTETRIARLIAALEGWDNGNRDGTMPVVERSPAGYVEINLHWNGDLFESYSIRIDRDGTLGSCREFYCCPEMGDREIVRSVTLRYVEEAVAGALGLGSLA